MLLKCVSINTKDFEIWNSQIISDFGILIGGVLTGSQSVVVFGVVFNHNRCFETGLLGIISLLSVTATAMINEQDWGLIVISVEEDIVGKVESHKFRTSVSVAEWEVKSAIKFSTVLDVSEMTQVSLYLSLIEFGFQICWSYNLDGSTIY